MQNTYYAILKVFLKKKKKKKKKSYTIISHIFYTKFSCMKQLLFENLGGQVATFGNKS